MSVPSIISKASHVYNGTTRTFDFNFRIVSQDDLYVSVDTVPLTRGTDYSVSGVNFYEGGSITIASGYALTNGAAVLIRRKVAAYTQETVFRNQGAFYAESVEDALDKLTMMSQELKLKSDLLPSFPDSEYNLDLTFPSPTLIGVFRWATRLVGNPAVIQYYITNGLVNASEIDGAVAIANGGTGATTQQAALNALTGTQVSGRYVRSNGTNASLSTLQAADLTGTVAITQGGTGATTQASAWTNLGMPQAASVAPSSLAASASVGTSDKWARQDHVHARPTLGELGAAASGANTDLTSVALTTGTVSSVAAGATAIANRGFVEGLAATAAPLPLAASSSVGTSSKWAKEDHVHARPTLADLNAAARGVNTDITSVALTSGTVTTTPANSNDLVNKAYVDAVAQNINFHNAVNVATTADLGTLTYSNGTNGVGATLTKTSPFAALVIDGQTLAVGNRVLVKNQSTAAQNGLYTVTNVGSGSTGWVLTRAADYDVAGTGPNEINQGDFILVISGTANASTSWILQSAGPFTIGTTGLTFTQFSAGSSPYTAGTGLSLTGYQFALSTPVSIANGGTGATTQQAALNALAGGVTSGQYLRGSGANVALSTLQAADLTGTVAISQGGTGATTQASAWTNLGMPNASSTTPSNVGSASGGPGATGTANTWARADHIHALASMPEDRTSGSSGSISRSDVYNSLSSANTGLQVAKDRFVVTGLGGYPIEFNRTTFINTGQLVLNTPADGDVLQYKVGVTGFNSGVWRYVQLPSGTGGTTTLAGDVTGAATSTTVSKIQGYSLDIPLTVKPNALFSYDIETNKFVLDTRVTDLLGYGTTKGSINIGQGALCSENAGQATFDQLAFTVSYTGSKQTLTLRQVMGLLYPSNSSVSAKFTVSAGSDTWTISSGLLNFDANANCVGASVSNTTIFGGTATILEVGSTFVRFDKPALVSGSNLTVSLGLPTYPLVSAYYVFSNPNTSTTEDATFALYRLAPVTLNTGYNQTLYSYRSYRNLNYFAEDIDFTSIGSPTSISVTGSYLKQSNIAIGKNAGWSITSSTGGIFIGDNANGDDVSSNGNGVIAIGSPSIANGENAIAIGANAQAGSASSGAIGLEGENPASGAIAIGQWAGASGSSCVAIGRYAKAQSTNPAPNSSSIAIGAVADADNGAIAIGEYPISNGGIAIGNTAVPKNKRIAIGHFAESDVVIDPLKAPRTTVYALGASGTNELTLPPSVATTMYVGMGISGTGIQANTVISDVIESTLGIVRLSSALTSAVTASTVLTLTHAFEVAVNGTQYGNTFTKICTATSGATVLNISGTTLSGNAGVKPLKVGATVSGTGIASQTKVTGFNDIAGTITISNATTAAITNGTITFNTAHPAQLTVTTSGSNIIHMPWDASLRLPDVGSCLSSGVGGIPVGTRILQRWVEYGAYNQVLADRLFVLVGRTATSSTTATATSFQRNDYTQALSASVSSANAFTPILTVSSSANLRVGDIVTLDPTSRPIAISTTRTASSGSAYNTVGSTTLEVTGSAYGFFNGLPISGTGLPAGTTITDALGDSVSGYFILVSNAFTATPTGSYTISTSNAQSTFGWADESGIATQWSGAEIVAIASVTEVVLSKPVGIPLTNVDIVVTPGPSSISIGDNANSYFNELAIGKVRLQSTVPSVASFAAAIPVVINGREGLIPLYPR